jgi:hypothetical protein
VAQNFATTPQAIYDALTGDSEFMSYVGTYNFVAGNTLVPSITITSPGADLPSLKSQSGLEVIIHDTGDVSRVDYLTDDYDPRVMWKVFFIVWEPATGLTMTNAVKRAMRILGGSTSIETVAVSSGLKALAQTLLMVPSEGPIMTVVDNYLTIDAQPQPASGFIGDVVTFTVSATAYDGGNLTYQWQQLIAQTWQSITGATSDELTLTITESSVDGTQFRCIVGTDDTAPDVISNSAALTILEPEPEPEPEGEPEAEPEDESETE